jgi:hypothetical protein
MVVDYPAWAQTHHDNVHRVRASGPGRTFPAWGAVNVQFDPGGSTGLDVLSPADTASDGGDAGAPATRNTDK